ncbi:MAG: TolC family protein [Bacteroidota bacterium]|nr:TolC family protein [Bacteroidota bacterium]MDP4212139.1 TolC family protein [Bacteroidota bacterium]MDP4249045.1 TolC family protein [Bacteroidota bacterium]
MSLRHRNAGRLLFLLTMALGTTSLKAQELHSLTIEDAIGLAKKNNLSVRSALINLQLQQQTNKAITAQALPSVSGTAGTTDFFQTPVTIVPGEFFGGAPGSTIAVSFQPKYSASAGVQLNQTIFDGQVFVGLKARKTSIDYYQKAVDLTVESITVNVYKVYYQLVVSKTQMKLLDANIERADKLLRDTRVMYNNGFAEKLDVDKATVQLANLQTTRSNTETDITNGYLGLKYLIGIPSADSVDLTTDFSEADLKQTIFLDSGYRYEDRFDYQSLQISKQLSEFDIKRYKALYYPTLSLTGAYQKNAYNNTYDFFTRSGNWYSTSYAGVSLKVPIFSGFEKDANLEKARLQASLVDNQIENLKLNIEYEVRQARNNFYAAIGTMDNQKGNATLAESVYDQTKKKFESGLASNTDLTKAQTDLIEAQTNYINALYKAVVAKIDYLKAIGKI